MSAATDMPPELSSVSEVTPTLTTAGIDRARSTNVSILDHASGMEYPCRSDSTVATMTGWMSKPAAVSRLLTDRTKSPLPTSSSWASASCRTSSTLRVRDPPAITC